MHLAAVAAVGALMGFLGGLLGKGGSAIGTPMFHAAGLPAAVAVAAPLPSTIPSTLAAGSVYARERLVDRRVLLVTIAFGLPATVTGAVLTRWVDADLLVAATDVLLVALGLRLALGSRRGRPATPSAPQPAAVAMAGLAVVIGLVSGLLANSGGFLLAPLYSSVLRLPLKRALATSLVAAAALAVPATIVHAELGHIDWRVVAVLTVSSVPLARLGARLAIRTDAARLERFYGLVLAALGTAFLLV